MPKIGIRQFIITLSSSQRTHTHQPLTPTRAFTSRLRSDFHRHPVSGATLPAYQTQSASRKPEVRGTKGIWQPQTPSPRHKVSNQKFRGGQRKTRSPLPASQTLSGPPGRRRGSLTRHKLRTVYPQHKSAGQRLFCAVRSGRTVAVLPHVRLCGRRSVPGSRRRRHPPPNAGRTPPWGRTSWPALPG